MTQFFASVRTRPALIFALSIQSIACVAFAVPPILVLTDSQQTNNPFGNYYAEILRGEGLMSFEQRDRAAWMANADPATFISSYKTVIVSEMNLGTAEQLLLRNFVQQGGTLVAARPVTGLSELFGIQASSTRPEQVLQYYGVAPQTSTGSGITHGALQFHGEATNYDMQGATPLAHLYDNTKTSTSVPAVTTNSYGNGRAIAFAYDPAKSIVLTRQGNPAWQNTEGDGIAQYRPHDMFSRTDGTNYYDPNKLPIPQADEMQRFFANIVVENTAIPMPRMWYLPGTHKTIMVNTGDGEDNFGPQFDQVLNDAASYGGKFSLYLRDVGIANTSVQQEAAWRTAGHEVGVHVYAGGVDGAGAQGAMTQAYASIVADLNNKFGHGARTARSHTIDWTGWVDVARIESAYGTQLDTNYYHYLNYARLNPLSSNGYFTGSGLPQRFIDSDGQLLPIYQAATQWADEWFADAGLSSQQTINIIKDMFHTAEEQGYYSAFVNNIHPVRYDGPDITSTWTQAIWEFCQSEGIPMWSAEMLLDFTRARAGSRFLNTSYSDEVLEFDYIAGAATDLDLTLMIPGSWNGLQLTSITLDGIPTEWSLDRIKGVDYAIFTPELSIAHVVASFAPTFAGDFNNDGNVDAADYVVWRETGINGLLGYEQWRNNFGRTPTEDANVSAVPEPSTAWVLIVAVLVVAMRRCDKSNRPGSQDQPSCHD